MIKEERLRIKSLSKSLQTSSKRRTGRQLITINHIMGLVGTLCLAQISFSGGAAQDLFYFLLFFFFFDFISGSDGHESVESATGVGIGDSLTSLSNSSGSILTGVDVAMLRC